MRKIKKCVLFALIMILLSSCGGTDENTDSGPETASPLQTLSQEEAVERIRDLCGLYIDPYSVSEEWYGGFTALADEGKTLLESENRTAADCIAMAEKLTESYRSIEYNRGDVPRIYISTCEAVPNLVENSVVTASSEGTGDNCASMAADGDRKTCWQSDEGEIQWLTLDAGREIEAGFFSVEWGSGAAKEYVIESSADGESWSEVVSFNDGAKYKTQSAETEEPVRLRYVRIRTTSASSLPYTIEEVTVSVKKPEKSVSLTKSEYREAGVVVVDKAGGKYPSVSETAMVKVRGNSTSGTVKQPYNLKFENKMKLLGMKGTRKWCLIANLFDKTMLRNKLAADFSAIAGVTPELKSTFVELYLDGEYKGCYLLTMPVSDGTVDIDREKGEMLLERIGYYDMDAAGREYNYSPIMGMRFEPICPDMETITEEEKQKIKNLLKEAEFAAVSGERERVEAVFDVESFVNMYICEELMKDIDIYHGSTYFYYKNDKLYSGPIWDMDLSMGNVAISESAGDEKYAKYHNLDFDGHKTGNGVKGDDTTGNWATVDFYKPLIENMWFRDLVKARYEELIPVIESMYEDGGMIDGYVDGFGGAFLRNYEEDGYSLTDKYFNCEYDHPFGTYEENVEYLKDWLRSRDAWIREDLGIE